MALIRSTLLASISGSIAGATFARNAAGAYMRNRTKPVNPNTPNQVLARGGFTASATSWRDLTDAQQAQWKTYAQNTPRTNRLGEVIHLSGIGEYMRLNGFLTFLQQAIVPNAPSAYGSPTPITSIVTVIDASADTLQFSQVNGSTIEPASIYGIWISNAVSNGVSYYKGPWSSLGFLNGDNVALTDLPIPFAVTVGQLFFIRIRLMDEFSRLGNEQIFGPFAATP